ISRRMGSGVNALSPAALGIALGVLAYALFGVHDATIKWLVADLPVVQVVFIRSAAVFAACLAFGRRRLLERALATSLKGPLLFRGFITFCAWICYFTAARSLTLAQLLCLYFAAPLMVTVLAAPLLGERVGAGRWAAVLIGFVGVLVATDPWGVPFSLATALVLIAAALWGYGVILMRQIARRESSLLQIAYINAVFLVGSGISCAFIWQRPDASQLALLLGVALFGGIGQFALFESARRAPAAVLATVEYSSLLWAFVLGYLIWGDIPPPAVFAGGAVILLAGIVLVTVERRLSSSRQMASLPP
ncbi:MAG: DMT family transporter, partial [Acetobacteraceae bacterium]